MPITTVPTPINNSNLKQILVRSFGRTRFIRNSSTALVIRLKNWSLTCCVATRKTTSPDRVRSDPDRLGLIIGTCFGTSPKSVLPISCSVIGSAGCGIKVIGGSSTVTLGGTVVPHSVLERRPV